MRKHGMKRAAAVFLGAAMVVSQCVPAAVWADTQTAETEKTAFEEAFANPDRDAKPFMRWWIAPGRMTEEEIRAEIKSFAEGGFGGVELQTLELAKLPTQMNDETWNETMKWIMKAGLEYDVEIDFTVGQMWPVATPEITDADDIRCEQQIWESQVDFTASEEQMTYSADALVYPEQKKVEHHWGDFTYYTYEGMDTTRDSYFIAATAAKVNEDGSLDPETAVDLLTDASAVYDETTGAITWTAPSEGNWKIFYYFGQTTNHTLGYGMTQYVIDHMSPEGTQAVIDNWEAAMDSDAELKELYEENAGSIFGDSFELKSNLWTPAMLKEFKERRGYDLTPYLPAIYNDMGSVDSRVIDDLYATETELLAENHMQALQKWANSHNMTLRYQAYSSAGSSVFELTYPALNIDIVEAESYAMSGTVPDSYKQLSGVVHMKKDGIYSAEAAEIGRDDWRETWTDTQLESGSENRHLGLMYYANRLFAGGVNKLVFHGCTYKFTDTENMYFPVTQTWPGYSAMQALSYGNEWGDKTPMWSNVDIMTDALSRYQMVLQQGQADIDLAVYRSQYGKGNINNAISAIEESGYTYDYVTPTVLNMDNAVIGEKDGEVVLAADGPSYKALIIEPLSNGSLSPMSLDTAEKILSYAKAGLPVVIIGSVPTQANTYPGSAADPDAVTSDENAQLAQLMSELTSLENVVTVADRTEAVTALTALGVSPDAQPEEEAEVYYQHRETENADLYYIYNDGYETTTQQVTLKGEGKPYLLDAWSGEITPIASYTTTADGVTITLDLQGQDSIMVAVAEDGFASSSVDASLTASSGEVVYDAAAGAKADVRSTEGGTVEITYENGETDEVTLDAPEEALNLTDWTFTLNQWTQADENDPFTTAVVPTETYDLSETGLVPWYEISEDLVNVAGVGVYTTTFGLNKGYAEGQGAYLTFTRVSDVARLFVNDTEVPMDQLSLKTDIGSYLKAGTNTIRVEVTSNMSNVKYGQTEDNTYAFGIIGDVTVTPYTYTSVDKAFSKRTAAVSSVRTLGRLALISAKTVKGAARYQFRYISAKAIKNLKNVKSLKNLGKNVKTVTSGSRRVLLVLKKGKYYVQTRAYRTLGGKKTYTKWSSIKSFTIR